MGLFEMPPGFWETKARNRAVMMYPFAPFLEEAGILLRAARRLWHPWSVRRLKELEEIANNLEGKAKMLRQRGLIWSSTIFPLDSGLSPEFVFSNAVWRRYHHDRNDLKDACPLIVSYLVSSATRILFFLLPIFEKIEKAEWSEYGHHAAGLKERIETLLVGSSFRI